MCASKTGRSWGQGYNIIVLQVHLAWIMWAIQKLMICFQTAYPWIASLHTVANVALMVTKKFGIHVPYSGKFSHGANFRIFRMRALHAKIKTTKIWTIENFAWTLTSLHAVKIESRQLELCKIFERPTQRILSRTIETEAKKAPKSGARASCCAVGHGWAAWVWSCSSGMRN